MPSALCLCLDHQIDQVSLAYKIVIHECSLRQDALNWNITPTLRDHIVFPFERGYVDDTCGSSTASQGAIRCTVLYCVLDISYMVEERPREPRLRYQTVKDRLRTSGKSYMSTSFMDYAD